MQVRHIKTSQARILFALSVALVFAFGCGKSHPPQKRELTPEEKAAKERKEVPGAISGKGWVINIKSLPQQGDGPMETVLHADADAGLIKDPHDLNVSLTGVTARLYQKGQYSASIKAPEASANQRDKTLVATGGVTVTSVTDPPDTVITSDKLYWNAKTNEMIAIGNAHAVMHTPEGKIRSTSGDRLSFDTRLKEIRNE
jgi:hypothetical protein